MPTAGIRPHARRVEGKRYANPKSQIPSSQSQVRIIEPQTPSFSSQSTCAKFGCHRVPNYGAVAIWNLGFGIWNLGLDAACTRTAFTAASWTRSRGCRCAIGTGYRSFRLLDADDERGRDG